MAREVEGTYTDGLIDGWCDFMILSEPIKTSLHNYAKYCEVKFKYELSIFSFNPTEYEKGYGEGGDLAAIYLGPCRVNGYYCRGCYACEGER